MRTIFVFIFVFSAFFTNAQTILNTAETSNRVVKDPVSVILTEGFSASSVNGNSFTAKIGNADDIESSNIDSNAGNHNPFGTVWSYHSFHDTQGNIEVGNNGQLQFTLPVALPPGIKSVAPQIHLIYNSGGGNGIAGYGWSISGVTAITRMNKTIERDGKAESVTLGESDYFAFNGQRLLLKSGVYGKDGAEYVTEKFSNVKIRSLGLINRNIGGTTIIGPEYWEVTFEDGSQAWYGNTSAGGSYARTPIEYNIVKWKDAQGNYINYYYSQSNNVSVIAFIKWGGNERLNTPHFNEILFNYTDRDLNETSYVNGVQFIQNKILSSIQVNTEGKQFKKYVVNYNNGTTGTKYQFVKNITEYNSENQPANPVVFEYEENIQPQETNTLEYAIKNTHTKKYGDFNYDGITDFIEIDTNGNLFFKNSIYINNPEIQLSYDKSQFSKSDFYNASIITYKKNGYVNNKGTGIVIPVGKYRPNSSYEIDYEFKIYSINIANKRLEYEYSKTLRFEDFKSYIDDEELDSRLWNHQHSTLIDLISYDYDGDGISEVVARFSSKKEFWGSIPPPNDPYFPFNELEEQNELNTNSDNHKVGILNKKNTEIFRDQKIVDTLSTNDVRHFRLPSDLPITPVYPNDIHNYASVLFDLKEETPYNMSVYQFESSPLFLSDWETADFNGDGIEELYKVYNKTLLNFYNIRKNNEHIYHLKSVMRDLKLSGWVHSKLLGDFNGDRKIDIAIPLEDKSSKWILYTSTGKGFEQKIHNDFIYFSSQQEVEDEGKHRNIIFEKSCRYSTVKYYQYSAVDLDQDGKSEIVSTEVRLHNHSWNSHSYQEYTNVALRVYSPIDFELKKSYLKRFNEKIISFSPLFINRHSHQIILIGRPEDCPSDNCNQNHIVHLNYPILSPLTRIKAITQGGLRTEIDYKELDPNKHPNFYAPVGREQYPYMEMDKVSQSYAVAQLRQIIDQDKVRLQDFRYRGFISHLQGKGVIGFRKTARSSWYANGFENTKIWNGVEIDPLKDGVPIAEWSIKTNNENLIFPNEITTGNSQLLSVKLTHYQHNILSNRVKALVPIRIITKDFQKGITNVSTITYDAHYLPIQTVSIINNGFATTTTDLSYIHNANGTGNHYFIGRPKSKTELVRAYGDSKGAKEDYEYENHLLKHKISWNENNSGWLKETYIYDGFGNIIQKTLSNSVDNNTQTIKSEYDSKGKFVIKKTDNLGLSTAIEYNSWGQITKQTDPLGNILTNTYDAWGKLLTTKTNLGGITSFLYEKLSNGSAKTTEFAPNGNVSISFTNKIGQTYKSATKAFENGKYIFKEIKYDALGRKISESEPYFEGEYSRNWNRIEYDVYSRPVRAISFTGKIIETSYNGNTVTVTETNANNRFKKQIFDALGNTTSSEDKGGVIHFKYNARGQNIEAKYGSNIVTTKYDEWGRKKEFHDPSNGRYTYLYNSFGTLVKEISPKGYKEYTYNALGQLVAQREITTDGTQNTDKSINYTYNNKGLITVKKGVSKGKPFANYITYDQYGRVLSTSEESYGKYYMQKGITYDDKNRITSYEKSLYSSGKLTAVTIQNIYAQWDGSLSQIKDKNTGKILWELKNTNAKGQITRALLGNTMIANDYDRNGFLNNINHHSTASNRAILQVNYRFDAIKNELLSRQTGGDFTIGESFTYDENNRLINWTNPRTGNNHYNIYDNQGRIIENDQLGKVKFENSNKIYQATSVMLNSAGEENLRNNLIQNISYNENNDPVFINGVKGDVRFEYGLSEMRQMVTFGGNINDQHNGKGRYTRYYSEDGSYEVTLDHQTNKEKHILYIGGRPYESDIIFLKDYSENKGSYKFLHKDYLGSILAISDEAGNKVEQRHYDAWGNLTHLQIGNGSIQIGRLQPTAYGLLLDRGYTSHEHLFEVGLIHMNGRLYDPLLRRFLNADEHIQDPYNTQNYNKYGYVLNNPLMYNDPSGEFVFTALAVWLGSKVLAAAVVGAVMGVLSYTVGLAVTGNLHQWSLGGALKSAFWGGVGGAVTFGIGSIFSSTSGSLTAVGQAIEKVVGKVGLSVIQGGTHAVAQGVLSVMQGGSFEQAFWSGALGSLGASAFGAMAGDFASSAGGTIAFGALSGGIGAELSGGNFWEGALIGGVVAGLNHAMHRMRNGDEKQKKVGNKKIENKTKLKQTAKVTKGVGTSLEFVDAMDKGLKGNSKLYTKLGKYGGRMAYGGQVVYDGSQYFSGEISGYRFGYRLGATTAGMVIGAEIGGPWGFVAGTLVGITADMIEYAWDIVTPQIQQGYNNFINTTTANWMKYN